MCVAAIAWDAHPRWRLVAIGNRDEFHARPAAGLAEWDDGSGILAGRDLQGGGTWLGVSNAGRFVLVTNFRVPGYPQPGRPSRGGLVTDLLTGTVRAAEVEIAAFNPFNLFVVEGGEARVLTNHPFEARQPLTPGVHGLSNGPFEGSWPKTRQLNVGLADWLGGPAEDFAPLLTALRAETPHPADAPDDAPPGSQPEARYAPVFIRDSLYGTRCSTVVAVDRAGGGTILERRYAPDGKATGETALRFAWPAA
ncbi:MAG TPA: NRDE family protein [Novosphingobium sp.]